MNDRIRQYEEDLKKFVPIKSVIMVAVSLVVIEDMYKNGEIPKVVYDFYVRDLLKKKEVK